MHFSPLYQEIRTLQEAAQQNFSNEIKHLGPIPEYFWNTKSIQNEALSLCTESAL
jgi:hypothetical protein